MKKKYSRFRELWAVPKYKILFKLGGYFIFFAVFFAIYAFGGPREYTNPKPTLSYNKMKQELSDANLSIKYSISGAKDYIIEGTIIDGVISGTLEIEELYRIKIKEDEVYLVKKDQEELTDLLNELNLIYLFPSNIVDIIDANVSVMRESDNNKIYSYTIDNNTYSVYINEKEIIKIVLIDGTTTYELEYLTIS